MSHLWWKGKKVKSDLLDAFSNSLITFNNSRHFDEFTTTFDDKSPIKSGES